MEGILPAPMLNVHLRRKYLNDKKKRISKLFKNYHFMKKKCKRDIDVIY